jgi:hypothetical protein
MDVRQTSGGPLLSPDEFRETCLQVARETRRDGELADRLSQHRRRADPAVAALTPAVYAMPLGVARRLVQSGQPDSERELMHAVLGLPDDRFASGLGAVAADCWDLGDWRLFGWLCLQLDAACERGRHPWAAMPVARPPQEGGPEDGAGPPTASVPEPLPADLSECLGRFTQAISALIDRRARGRWNQVVRGYLLSIPPSFLPPTDLAAPSLAAPGAAAGTEGWPLLRHLLAASPRCWWWQRDMLRELTHAPSPFVHTLAEGRQLLNPAERGYGLGADDPASGPLDDMSSRDLFGAFLLAADDPAQCRPPAEPPPPPEEGQEIPREGTPIPLWRLWWMQWTERRWTPVEIGAAAVLAVLVLVVIWLLIGTL